MGLKIEELRKPVDGAMYRSPQRLYVTAEGRLCNGDDPEAANLLVGEGGEISNAEAAKYGLLEPKGEAEGLASHTVDELRSLAADKGLEVPPHTKKGDLIALLEEVESTAEA